MISLNPERIQSLATSLQTIPLSPNHAELAAPRFACDDETYFRSVLCAMAICHATKGGLSGLFHGKSMKGTDFLLHAFGTMGETNPEALDPKNILTLSADGLRGLLTANAQNATLALTDLDRRAEILRTLAADLIRLFDGRVSNLLEQAQHRIGGDTGAYQQLAKLTAYQDPLHKKSGAFLLVIFFSGRWIIHDIEHAKPMVDYHKIRLFCRMGCIDIQDQELAQKLRDQQPVSNEIGEQLRDLSGQLMRQLIQHTGRSLFELDIMLWTFARSACRRTPVCVNGNRTENNSFEETTGLSVPPCPGANWCPGAHDESFRFFWEPQVTTEDY